MSTRFGWHELLKEVDREHQVAELAVDRLLLAVKATTESMRGDLQIRDLVVTRERLESTYFIRMYAVFESALRDFWSSLGSSRPPMKDLIDGIASRRRVSGLVLSQTHSLRRARNLIIHGTDTETSLDISLKSARKIAAVFVSRLPEEWGS